MRVLVETHGCRLNRADSEGLERALADDGHALVQDVAQAEVYVLNSCTITHGADADARQAIRRAVRENPGLEVVVTGCYANADPGTVSALPGVRAVVGTLEKAELAAVVASLPSRMSDHEPLVSVTDLTRRLPQRPAPWRLRPRAETQRVRPHLKIQDGCDLACAFCIVPKVRGRSRSLPIKEVASAYDELAEAGVPEVIVTGVHLGIYGWDLGMRDGLERLVAALVDRPGPPIRLGSIDPHEVSVGLVDVLARAGGRGLCRHLHLPIQSGSDRVLKVMRRSHRADDLVELVPRLRATDPDLCIGSDIVVGHPGEDDRAFEETFSLCASVEIDYAHVFSFSPRPETAAAEMEAPASAIAAERSKRLRNLFEDKWNAFQTRMMGRPLPAVVLRGRSRNGRLWALTDNYVKVEIEGSDRLMGRRVVVEPSEHHGLVLQAVIRES